MKYCSTERGQDVRDNYNNNGIINFNNKIVLDSIDALTSLE